MKLTLAPSAARTIRREVAYLGANSPKAAQRFLDDLKQLRRNLKRFPAIGKQTDEMPVLGVLRFVMGPYLVDYEVRPGESSSSLSAMVGSVRRASRWTMILISR